jgi:hypothetical protein
MQDELNNANIAENTVETPQEQPRESNKEFNMRMLREQKEAADRRAELAEKRLVELERMAHQGQQSQQVRSFEDTELDLPTDSYLDTHQFKQYDRQIKQNLKELKNEQKRTAEMIANFNAQQAEDRLKSKYTDFDKIVNPENIERLKYTDPDAYNSIYAAPDIKSRGIAAYNILKNNTQISGYYEEERRIEQNKSKPKSVAQAAATPSSPFQSIGNYERRVLTEEHKEALRRNVAESKKYR